TEDTRKWRQRFGFTHTQLTGLDDVLRLDYVTDGFNDINAFFGAYEGLIPGVSENSWLDGVRWRWGASRTKYSSEVGIGVATGGVSTREVFEGDNWMLSLGLVKTIHQSGGLFVDAGAGLRWMDIDMTNLSQFSARMPFAIPSLTLEIEDLGPGAVRYAHFALEKSVPALAGTSHGDFEDFETAGGRLDLDDDWTVLRWDAGWRFQPGAPRRAGTRALSLRWHEIEFSTEGQYSFNNRLIPQEQGVVGGLYTVRGYPQSAVAGDSIFVGHAEYRYHLPLELAQAASARWLNWDLILKGFFDFGFARNGSGGIDEGNESLASVGVGCELQLRQNLSLRLDHGIALAEIDHGRTEPGDSETHLSAVVRY
ncbi:MAG TPA: ShlB/FhaC/HecB family hemolysin secretion/activation protein, partial [Myxococcota bacterium]|nr:ShlB/FhaC/HecB family hemolysin secretion/activation protein [Myxococcota bacterium]